ncbi:phage tail protein [Sphingobium sufflavum]|uniref:phage tail protein n=1 Tax=Sphingobium sufflavum TaxID=1129547 RepID=UPI001F3D202F|nr:phage tail protein [Sphingobium sufflavum]MCE7798641.1 phage tail protein [Sphingobium sufflavum]
MATVVLTAVGSLFGPVGAAVGALAGQAIDGILFKPAGREGPRIVDLRVQTSSFGTQIPRLFGAMRVAGTVIWSTDLMESAETSGGGKGRPSVTTYHYAASFAVALSSRPIAGIGRIWADGNLLRGVAGDFKVGIGAFRVHDGAADQPVDPLIAADRGSWLTPAHRGLAYVLFEGLQLADFGNRIPSLTFEIFADEGGVAVPTIASVLAGGGEVALHEGGDMPVVGGYAAAGDSAGEALQPLLDSHDLLLRPMGAAMALTGGAAREMLLRIGDDLAMARGEALAGRTVERKPVEAVPRRLSVRHYDPARDYQAGIQSAERQGAGAQEAHIDLPATLDAAGAQQRATDLLRRRMLGRRTVTMARGWDALALGPGDVVALEGQGGGWRVEAVEWEGMAVRLGLTAVPTRPAAMPEVADSGSAVRERDRLTGPTHLMLVETPQPGDVAVDSPQLFAAACGAGGGWRGAAILVRDEAGGYAPLGSVRRAAVAGVTATALASGTARLFDMASTVEVVLHDGEAVLSSVSDAALMQGGNACLIGEELVQFGSATPVGPGRYRLGRLLRGRRGTETAMGGHGAGEGFLLLDPDRLLPLGNGQAQVGRLIELAAQGLGDATPAEASRIADGRALVPPSPVHLSVAGSAAEGLEVRWVRRSRLGWAWRDGVDAPLGEEQEAYRVEVRAGELLLRSGIMAAPHWSYPPDAIAVDLAAAGSAVLTLSICQRGTHGPGAAARIALLL